MWKTRKVKKYQVTLLPLHKTSRAITKEKYNDMHSLLFYISPIHHEYFTNETWIKIFNHLLNEIGILHFNLMFSLGRILPKFISSYEYFEIIQRESQNKNN